MWLPGESVKSADQSPLARETPLTALPSRVAETELAFPATPYAQWLNCRADRLAATDCRSRRRKEPIFSLRTNVEAPVAAARSLLLNFLAKPKELSYLNIKSSAGRRECSATPVHVSSLSLTRIPGEIPEADRVSLRSENQKRDYETNEICLMLTDFVVSSPSG